MAKLVRALILGLCALRNFQVRTLTKKRSLGGG